VLIPLPSLPPKSVQPQRSGTSRLVRGGRTIGLAFLAWVASALFPGTAFAQSAAALPISEPSTEAVPRRMSDAAELERVVDLYLAGQYDACLEQFGPLLDRTKSSGFSEPLVLEKGRLYAASCAVLSGHIETARAQLKTALNENPLMATPDSLAFPPPLVGLFLEVREEVRQVILARERDQVQKLTLEAEANRRAEEQRAGRERELLRLAQEERVIATNSRWVAALPFGAGQYQNGDKNLGHLFLATEVGLTTATFVSFAVLCQLYSDEVSQALVKDDPFSANYTENDAAIFRTTSTVLTVSSIALTSVVVLGILEAQLSFQDERVISTRKRPLPASLQPGAVAPGAGPSEKPKAAKTGALGFELAGARVVPEFGAGPSGANFGLRGVF
jgi:hypothetical protein